MFQSQIKWDGNLKAARAGCFFKFTTYATASRFRSSFTTIFQLRKTITNSQLFGNRFDSQADLILPSVADALSSMHTPDKLTSLRRFKLTTLGRSG
jgi:hypothetical protein